MGTCNLSAVLDWDALIEVHDQKYPFDETLLDDSKRAVGEERWI